MIRWLGRFGIHALVLVYVLLNLPLIASKPETFEQIKVFSNDEYGVCNSAFFLVQTGSLIARGRTGTAGPGGLGQTCNPFPYGQFYNILIAVPLMVVGLATSVTELMVIRWAVLVMVLSGVAALVLTYLAGARLYSRPYGVLAALLLLFTPEFLRWSNEIHPDLVQLACLLAGFYFCLRLYESTSEPGRRLLYTVVASFFAGLAMATKLNGIFLLPVIVVAYNRAFIQAARPLRIGRLLVQNAAYGVLTLAVFTGTFSLGNPCLVRHPDLAIAPFSRFGEDFSRNAQIAAATAGRLANLFSSSTVLAENTIGYAMFTVCILSLIVAGVQLIRHPGDELQSPRILTDVFLWIFLTYSLVFGYGLVDGRLRSGYQRYILPAVPILYISGMRVLSAVVDWARRFHFAAGLAVILIVLQAQSHLFESFRGQYEAFYLRKELGFFKVHEWIRQNVPKGSIIHTEFYIYVPEKEYTIWREYAVSREDLMHRSDYVITKTLDYDIYKNPDRWAVYKNKGTMMESRRIYERLEEGFPGFERVAFLSAGETFGRNDAVAVYKNMARTPPPTP